MKRPKIIQDPYFFLVLALILFFPAYLINLGDQPIIEDEAIRSIVAFEMFKSGDYVTPTIGGAEYLRKPPLYNWFIAGSFALFGNYSETAIRFPMILSLFLFALTIFLIVRRELGTRPGVINALIYLTLGRIILYESLHGLIDITFSWVTYLMFMCSYILFRKQRYLQLFIIAYLLTAVAWMMKGLPSLVFLGITLLVLFISNRKFKLLFSWKHFLAIFIFILLTGSYYLVYFSMNEISPEELFGTLLGQTTRRTVVRFGWWVTLQHIFTFPFEMLYHFLPWSLLTLLLFAKGAIKRIWSHPFLRYNILVLLFNIIPYWTSPEVHPRYILMLVPLYFTVLSWLFLESRKEGHLMAKLTEYIFGAFLLIAVAAPWASLFVESMKGMPLILVSSIVLSGVMAMICVLYRKYIRMRLFWFAIGVLVLRIGFDLMVLPTRQDNSREVLAKESAYQLADLTKGKPLYSYWNPEFTPTFYYMKNFLAFRYHYHLSAARDEIVYNISREIPGALYISHEKHISNDSVTIIGHVVQHIDNTSPLPLFTFHPPPSIRGYAH